MSVRRSLETVGREACRRSKVCVGMKVLARSRDAGWQKGRVLKAGTTGNKWNNS